MQSVVHFLNSGAWGGLESYTLEFVSRHSTWQNPLLFCQRGSPLWQKASRAGIAVTDHWRQVMDHKAAYWHVHSRKDLYKAQWGRVFFLGKNKPRILYSLMMNPVKKSSFYHSWLYGSLDRLFAPSHQLVEEVRQCYPMVPKKVCHLPYGRDVEYYSEDCSQEASKLRDELGIGPDELVFGSIARLDLGKGVQEFLSAFDLLPPHIQAKTHLWWVGDPTMIGVSAQGEPIYEQQAQSVLRLMKKYQQLYPGHIHWTSYREDPRPYYQAFDVFVLASHKETYSLAVIEAMLSARAVLGTNAGGTPEQLGRLGERGLLVKPRDAEALAHGMVEMFHAPRADMGRRGQEWAKKVHSWENHLSLLQKYLSEVDESV